MANGIFRAVFGGCMLFIIASALIWFFDLIPIQAKLDSGIGISSDLDLIHLQFWFILDAINHLERKESWSINSN